MAKFRVDYSGRGELSERQQFLGKHLALLTLVAKGMYIAYLLLPRRILTISAEFNVLVFMV